MENICNYYGWSSRTQGLQSQRYSFSKKLLVAICLSVIIAMCLTPTEAASLAQRQLKQLSTETKEMAELPSEELHHRRRHQRHTKMTKVEEHMLKIKRNLKLTKNDFREHKDSVNDSDQYRDHKIKVPATNFLDLHRHLQSLKNKNLTPAMREHKFLYIAGRLYRSLFKYSEIFKALQSVNVVPQDVEFSNYQGRRRAFLTEIVRNLNNILPVIGDGIRDFKKNVDLTNPLGEKEEAILHNFKSEVAAIDTAEKSLKYDGIIFRSYGILLKKWYCIVSSKQDRTNKENARCQTIESKMRKSPKKHRKQKKKRRNSNI